VWLVLAALLGAAQAVYSRNSMNPDGIAYLDLGDAYIRGDWATAIRSHWSPLYAWILAAVLRTAQPPPSLEFPLVHAVNLGIFALALAAFTFLLFEVLTVARSGLSESIFVSIGYAAFVWSTLQYTPLSLVTPDLLVAVFVYSASGLILRLRRQPSWRGSVLLGGLLGVGYLAKTPMLPLALVFLAVSAAFVNEATSRLAHVGVAALALAVVSVPFVLVLSLTKGRPTIGDSATLNYLWRINRLPVVHWQGGPEGVGQPVHHSTTLLERPPVFAFESPFSVTYSAWYAPEYWFAGATPVVTLAGQLEALADALQVYAGLATDLAVPIVGFAVLLILQGRPRGVASGPWLVLFAPAMAAFALFALVLVEARYVAPFVVLLLLGLLTLVRRPDARRSAALAEFLGVVVAAAMVLQIGWNIAGVVGSTLSETVRAQLRAPDEHARVAATLRAAGIQPGDRVASGNRAFNAYWARLARVSIVAEVSGYDATAILEAEPDARAAAQRVLLAQQVRAVVAHSWPALTGDPGWRAIEGTDFYVYLH